MILDPPKIAIRSPIKVHLGGEAEINCADISNDVGSRPMPTRIWSKVNDVMPPPSRRRESNDGILTISNVARSDAGKYKCAASNGVLSNSAFGDLEVYGKNKYLVQLLCILGNNELFSVDFLLMI